MIALFTLLSFVFYMASAAPLLSGNNDQKMLNGQSSYQSFSFLDLPVIAKLPKDLNDAVVSEHQVKADLAVVESDEADNTGPEQIDGYGDSKPLDMSVETENKDSSPKPIGVVPKLTGTIIGAEPKVFTDKTGAAITNPTAYFLEGVDLEKVEKPKCRMIGCDGPIVEDDVFVEQDPKDKNTEKCYQAFVPIVDAQVRVGMICRVCCESGDLLKELKKTRLDLSN